MKISLSLTHQCNLRCRYCYAGEKHQRDMPFDTAQQAVDLAFRQANQTLVDIAFFGGEPLLKPNLMRRIAAYIHEQAIIHDTPYRLGVTTNGTLLNANIMAFLQQYNVNVCVSLDGPAAIHNQNRIFRNGNGSHARVARNLQTLCAQLKNIQINAVYNSASLPHLADIFNHLAGYGASAIHLNLDIHGQWGQDAVDRFADSYQQVAESYVGHYRQGQELALNLLDSKILLFLKGGYSPCDHCGMGDKEWAVAPSGNIYPCERLIGEDNNTALCIGNVQQGFDKMRKSIVTLQRGNFNSECQQCSVRKFCMNWCGCTNYHMSGHTGMASAALCASERAAIRAAKHAFLELNREGNGLFAQHLMGYLLQDGHIESLPTPDIGGQYYEHPNRMESRSELQR